MKPGDDGRGSKASRRQRVARELCLGVAFLAAFSVCEPARAIAAESGLREPAPRPLADVRVQPRFVQKEGKWHLFAGVDYYERRDYYLNPGLELGVAHSLSERFSVGVQGHHFFSSLNSSATDVARKYGVLPNSLAPAWLLLGELRYDLGYGKILIEGLRQVLHFEPQVLVAAGVHVNGGQLGPTGLVGLGLAFHPTPILFFRLEGALALAGESVQGNRRVTAGFLPALTFGGTL